MMTCLDCVNFSDDAPDGTANSQITQRLFSSVKTLKPSKTMT